jgi:sigma-B regulation protein RsbU (phosphoserine phosphatase)
MLNKISSEKRRKQTIGWLGNESYFIYENATVEDLISALESEGKDQIYALAVVDRGMKILGMVVLREIYALIGRQYGRAILGKKCICEIMKRDSSAFDFEDNIFSVGEDLDEKLKQDEITYYLLKDQENKFKGIFSSRDILIHLSNMTKNDMVMAQSIQRKISMEETSIHETRFDLVALTRPVMDVGGDCYFIKKYTGKKWILSVCDVSGKGIAASLLTTTIWGMMSIYEFTSGCMPFLKKVNSFLHNTLESEKFITGIFLDFNSKSGKVLIYDMGHSYLYIHRKAKLRLIPLKGNTPLGIQEIESMSRGTLFLERGDFLFIPTDGLLEQTNSQKITYSIKRVENLINLNLNKPIELIKEEISRDFMTFKGREHVHDDVTFLLLKYYGEAEADDEYT